MSTFTGHITEHQMTRIDVPTDIAFDRFRAAFEQAVPAFDEDAIRALTENGGTWADIEQAVAARAPYELLVYARIDATELLGVAGHRTCAVEYLVGNHVIAETMYRHDPKALLYAPLRILIHSDTDGTAILSIDQPSTAFASLGIPEVTAVGIALDHKIATVLEAIGVDTAEVFRSRRQRSDS
ncbi:DUF302 domain-containing protein [Mycobacterium sp. 050134]|uniref:DUF302 domain-containing protein n=1 Tax=Mycobacterium sp. 050134 TaxID=3096111 RepID=UPI002ED7ABF8